MIEPEEIWTEVLPRLREFIAQTGNVKLVCELTDATPGTVGEWLTEVRPPTGVRLLTVWHLLNVYGPLLPSMDGLEPLNRYLGQLLAFQVMTMEEVCEVLNVKNAQTVFRILRGQKPMQAHYTLSQLRELYDDQLRRELADLPRRKRPAKVVAAASEPAPPAVEKQIPDAPASTSPPASLTLDLSGIGSDPPLMLAMLLGAALPLARHLNQPEDPGERNRYRKLVGLDGLEEQLNELIALKSERARKNRR